mmetsp:Transcript_24789/g.58167  ORF Transcript_24789/g.58167 Transcript_24789/m.58167 type:complete len:93 (+) Transcript_24789:721-999(+)
MVAVVVVAAALTTGSAVAVAVAAPCKWVKASAEGATIVEVKTAVRDEIEGSSTCWAVVATADISTGTACSGVSRMLADRVVIEARLRNAWDS